MVSKEDKIARMSLPINKFQNIYYLIHATIVLITILQTAEMVSSRHLQPANFRVANFRDFQQEDNRMPMMTRRQDFEDDDDSDDADESGDHNAAASYRNQDDGANQNPNDGYEDSEADGPYEETPVEREGQADLERFFDDHLGASDRDGMDKENLPSDLVLSLLDAPIKLEETNKTEPKILKLMNSDTIQNPIVNAAQRDSLAAMPTIQTTSFIRLPEEKKMIVTNQITRNTINRPIVSFNDDQTNDKTSHLRSTFDDNNDHAHEDHEFDSSRLKSEPSSSSPTSNNNLNEILSNIRLNSDIENLTKQQQQYRQPSLSANGNQAGQQDARSDKMKATESEVVITENDDEDRIYVTNATNKPFKIDALGGYDPEADFQDAAEELDSYGEPVNGSGYRAGDSNRRPYRPYKVSLGESDNRDEDREGSDNHITSNQGELSPGRQGFSFQESPDTDMYEDASETDEVTFAQDDPYQTDLEAEMRQQNYDKVGHFMRKEPAVPDTASSDSVVDNGEPSDNPEHEDSNEDADEAESSNGESRNDENQSRKSKPSPREDTDEEGSWANDGVDEMDIPSQSHQNFILDKAAKHDAMVRKAAEDELEAKRRANQQPESDQTSNDDEESQRMPNANYLKNDLIEDDSGYAA